MKTTVGKTKVELANGDITQLEVDALVAPSSTELWMDHGVAAAIKRAGADVILTYLAAEVAEVLSR